MVLYNSSRSTIKSFSSICSHGIGAGKFSSVLRLNTVDRDWLQAAPILRNIYLDFGLRYNLLSKSESICC